MRPHRLELEAFGAFPEHVEIDLDGLADGGLVLLCGPTGAGKTTLLDAICFALYGTVPGQRARVLKELRSHHAAPTRRTWVRLEFSVGARRLRIERQPEQSRPAKRGGGVVVDKAKAQLHELIGAEWVSRASRVDDAGMQIQQLLGMTADQFNQVVLLPQGRFAEFLHAGHDDRERLLKRLFHVNRFEYLERWLADQARDARRVLEAAEQQLRILIAQLATATGAEAGALQSEAGLWAERVRAEAGRAVRRHTAAMESATRVAAEAGRSLRDTEQLADRQHRRQQAELEQRQLLEQTGAIEALRDELETARRAEPVQVALRARAERAAEAAEHSVAEARLRQRLAEHAARSGWPIAADADADALRRAGRELAEQIGQLDRSRVARAQVAGLERAAAEARERAVQQQAQAEKLAHRLDEEITAARAALSARLDEGERATSGLPGLTIGHQRALERVQLVRSRAEVETTLRAARDKAVGFDSWAAHLRQQHAELREQRIDAITTELASALADGDECPVCGALEHPNPAAVRVAHVSREAEAQADEAARQAGEIAAAQRAEVARLEQQLADLATRIGDPIDRAEIEALADELGARLVGQRELASGVAGLRVDLEQLADETARLTGERHRAEESVGQELARADEADQRAAQIRDEYPDVEVEPSLDGAQLRVLAGTVDEVENAVRTAEASRREHERASIEAELAAERSGFASTESAASAARGPEWLLAADRDIRAHESALAAVAGRLGDPELAVELDPPAPVAAARSEAAAADVVLDGARVQLTLAEERHRQAGALVPRIIDAAAALEPLRATAAELGELAEVAAGRGANRRSMPLPTFVLAARLTDVAAAASTRLARMSAGRFTLVHDDSVHDKRSKAGLGLQVEDAWTGTRRETASLSGGESFQAALALALGLADVVQADAGGTAIEALFVDEGFGTLDPEALDEVMDVLDGLRSGGRLVGIVSHVADLRDRIPMQIEVAKGIHGSTVSVSTAR